MNDASVSGQRRWLGILGNALTCLAVLGASAAAIVVINRTEPTAQQVNTKRKSAALVDTVIVTRGTHTPRLSVLGTVQPAQSIALSPRVAGEVIEVAPEFVPGGMAQKGDLLVRIDPTDFENVVSVRESELKQVEASLEIEKGRQSLAKDELELLGDSINQSNRALVLREPQFKSIQSQVSAAKVAVARAKLDLQRTQVVAPFDAQILTRSVNVGSQVGSGDELGRLVGIEEYWIMAAVPVRSLRWIQFPSEGQTGSLVRLKNPDAWGPDAERPARVAKMIGTLDQETRLARVLITVQDPLGRKSNVPPLILDTLVEVIIDAREIDNVCRLAREHVHEGDTVRIMQDNKLVIRKAEVVFRDAEYVYIRDGLEDGDEVVTTTLATVADGIGLRRNSDPPDLPAGEAAETTE